MEQLYKDGKISEKAYNGYVLYKKGMAFEAKVKGLGEIYQQMNTSQYKRAVTMYKRKR